jgi:hypothetical protein
LGWVWVFEKERVFASLNTRQNLVRVDKPNKDRMERNLEKEMDLKTRGYLKMIMEFCVI